MLIENEFTDFQIITVGIPVIALKTDWKKPAIKGIPGFCPRLLSLPDRQGNYGKTLELNEVNSPLRGARKAG